MAGLIIESNEDMLGSEVVEKAKEKITKNENNENKEEEINEEKQKRFKRAGRTNQSI